MYFELWEMHGNLYGCILDKVNIHRLVLLNSGNYYLIAEMALNPSECLNRSVNCVKFIETFYYILTSDGTLLMKNDIFTSKCINNDFKKNVYESMFLLEYSNIFKGSFKNEI